MLVVNLILFLKVRLYWTSRLATLTLPKIHIHIVKILKYGFIVYEICIYFIWRVYMQSKK